MNTGSVASNQKILGGVTLELTRYLEFWQWGNFKRLWSQWDHWYLPRTSDGAHNQAVSVA